MVNDHYMLTIIFYYSQIQVCVNYSTDNSYNKYRCCYY